jgi:hypothetical protein
MGIARLAGRLSIAAMTPQAPEPARSGLERAAALGRRTVKLPTPLVVISSNESLLFYSELPWHPYAPTKRGAWFRYPDFAVIFGTHKSFAKKIIAAWRLGFDTSLRKKIYCRGIYSASHKKFQRKKSFVSEVRAFWERTKRSFCDACIKTFRKKGRQPESCRVIGTITEYCHD